MPNKRADNKKHLDFWVDIEVFTKLTEIAKNKGCSRSDILNELATQLIKRKEKNDDTQQANKD